MGRRILKMALLGGLCACSPALAAGQAADPPVTPPTAASPTVVAPAAAPAPPAVPTPPPAPSNLIPAGTIVTVELTEPLSASKSKSGDHFGIRLSEPIVIGGAVLVPAGVTGQGEVIDAKPANIGGRPGRLVLAARYLESGPLRLTLQSFKLGGGGKDHSILAVDATIAVGLIGVLVTGGSVDYAAGTRATAKIAADVTTAQLSTSAPTSPPGAAPASPSPTPSP